MNINYQSDFKIVERLMPDAPFRFTYYVAKDKGSVTAEYDGQSYSGCLVDGDRLIVPVDGGTLGIGNVMVKREYFLDDKAFADGVCNLVSVEGTDIELGRGRTDSDIEADVEVGAPYKAFTFDDMTEEQKQEIADRVVNDPTKVTYAELREMRDNSDLATGHLYRITDYEFTTKQAETKSAGHVFDIIVLAVAENELSHIARAIAHEGDTYFDGNDLGAWELWYELDNDAEKYAWADAENGKGIIYRMIDEKRNDCPYDFKNALFYNDKLTTGPTEDKYYYTFSYVVSGVLYDGTVEKQVTTCYGNSMGVYISSKRRTMNKNVLVNTAFGNSCHSNTFGNECYSNTFGDSCYRNTFGNYCYRNTFGNYFFSREVDMDKTSITLNDEYYDDGSGQLVPIKHPDLSTQPSILPYKFMGQYVYEQLIPTTVGSSYAVIKTSNLPVSDPIFIEAWLMDYTTGDVIPARTMLTQGSVMITPTVTDVQISGYARIVFTSMPEDGGYYGYSNY